MPTKKDKLTIFLQVGIRTITGRVLLGFYILSTHLTSVDFSLIGDMNRIEINFVLNFWGLEEGESGREIRFSISIHPLLFYIYLLTYFKNIKYLKIIFIITYHKLNIIILCYSIF